MSQPGELPPAEPPIVGQQVAMKAVIYREDGSVLMLEEARDYEDASLDGKLCFPGGRTEPGEDLDAALHREVTVEETGLEVIIEEPIGYGWWAPVIKGKPRNQIVGIFVACRQVDPEVEVRLDPKEHSGYRWIGRAAFSELMAQGLIAQPDDRILETFWQERGFDPA